MRRVEERVEDNKSGEDDTFKKCFQKMPSKDAFKICFGKKYPRCLSKDSFLLSQIKKEKRELTCAPSQLPSDTYTQKVITFQKRL